MIGRAQVGDVLRELGFNESQAAGQFYWFENPFGSRDRDNSLPVARVQFYEPAAEFKAWLFVPWKPNAKPPRGSELEQYVESVEEVRGLAQRVLRWRLIWIASSAGAPERLLRAAETDESAGRVLRDWLEENGVPS